MMIGEMDASHTGISAGGGRGRGRAAEAEGDTTRFPGLDLEPAGGYWMVRHVYRRGPADKDYIKIKAGDYVLAIDGRPLTADDDVLETATPPPASGSSYWSTPNRPRRERGRSRFLRSTSRRSPTSSTRNG